MYATQKKKKKHYRHRKRSSNTSTSFLSPPTLLRFIKIRSICCCCFCHNQWNSDWLKNHQTGLSLIPCKFGLGNHRFIISLKEIFSQKHQLSLGGNRTYSNCKSITAMQMNDLCNNSVPACKNINNPNDKPIKMITNSQRTSVGILQ